MGLNGIESKCRYNLRTSYSSLKAFRVRSETQMLRLVLVMNFHTTSAFPSERPRYAPRALNKECPDLSSNPRTQMQRQPRIKAARMVSSNGVECVATVKLQDR
ncbi:hypothetical protein BS47DRAFT_1354418 [Hydnum rufescens UP504]|uniref:Uncharacterized protein n=1 Tax=Hydnum rufescens UP504 TaxID=1448309 RepID=A0A9P6DN93_9AGAM|nr:hypothetical protein BS47DRAFT_1354418 [Hydnum rufescens UP504]